MSEDPQMKRCRQCGIEKPMTTEYFYRHKKDRTGFRIDCKICMGSPKWHEAKKLISEGLSRCAKCREIKPITEYYVGAHSWCKSCVLQSQRDACLAKATIRAQQKALEDSSIKKCTVCGEVKPATTEFFREITSRGKRTLNAKCRDCVSKQKREYRQLNHERIIEENREWKRRNPGRVYETTREYRQRNLARVRKQKKVANHRREARKRGLPNTLTTMQWQRALDYFGHRCAICNRSQGLWYTLAADHWIPLTDPRPGNLGTAATNILPMCHSKKGGIGTCNLSKGKKDPLEWLYSRFPKKEADAILERIEAYFIWVRQQDD